MSPLAIDVSGSGLPRAMECDGAALLPRDARETSVAAERGTIIHEYLRACLTGTDPAVALAAVPEAYQYTCESIEVERAVDGAHVVGAEYAFAYDPRTGVARLLGENIGRDYAGRGLRVGEEIPCSLDLILDGADWLDERELAVVDFKTGQLTAHPAKSNWQVILGCLCVRSVFAPEAASITGKLGYVDEDGGWAWDRVRFPRAQLDAFQHELAATWSDWALTATGEQDLLLTPGNRCTHCDRQGACPAMAKEVRALATVDDAWVTSMAARILGNDEAAVFYEKLGKMDAIVDKLKALWRQRVAQGPVRLPDGEEVRMIEKRETRIDGKRALAVLREAYGEEIAEAACKTTVSQAALKQSFGKDAKLVFERLRAEGATYTNTRNEVRLRRARD